VCVYISRHINYTFELLATYAWAPPLQFTHILPYFYSLFLTALLLHRVVRDEERCALKYGKPYDEYCKKVPYRIIPGVI
jgi:protein-S-isoprenylcysteine O-methyltransferase Ste14